MTRAQSAAMGGAPDQATLASLTMADLLEEDFSKAIPMEMGFAAVPEAKVYTEEEFNKIPLDRIKDLLDKPTKFQNAWDHPYGGRP